MLGTRYMHLEDDPCLGHCAGDGDDRVAQVPHGVQDMRVTPHHGGVWCGVCTALVSVRVGVRVGVTELGSFRCQSVYTTGWILAGGGLRVYTPPPQSRFSRNPAPPGEFWWNFWLIGTAFALRNFRTLATFDGLASCGRVSQKSQLGLPLFLIRVNELGSFRSQSVCTAG